MKTKLLVSTRKGLVIFNKQHGTWKEESLHFKGIPISLSHYDPAHDALWAFQDHGHWGVKMSVSKDQGASWEEVPAPVFEEGKEVKEGIPATLRYIWAVSSKPVGNGSLWLGSDPGGLFMSSDGGATFSLNEGLWNVPERTEHWMGGGRDLPGIHSIVVDPRDHNHIYVGISVAGVYETTDGGQTWQARNKGLRADFLPDPESEFGHDPHLLTLCAAQPDVLWQQNHCGIFRSTDGGKQWSNISETDGPAHFGFAIVADEDDPDTAWVAPAISDEIRVAVDQSLCISRTEDGGKSWTALRNGLPQGNAYDIVYRHALVKDGDDLVFGTTTGNLFHSRDRGDSWNAVSHYLPMVYALDVAEMP